MVMGFAAIFVTNFMVQAVVRSETALRERALALIEGVPPIWSVVAANEAAERAGIQLGMTKSQVEQFCEIETRHRSQVQEGAAHAALLDLGWSISPRIEDAAADTVVVDFAGLNSLLGPHEIIAKQIMGRAADMSLTVNVAVATTIDVAILAARGFPGLTVIPAGEEAKRLGPLPVSVLSPSIEILETLEIWGIYTCEALAVLPVLQLSERLGQEGVRLFELASGKSMRSLMLAEPETHFEEEIELEDSVEELEPLSFLLARLLNQLCVRLTARSLAACAIRMRFELDPAFSKDTRGENAALRSNDFRQKAPVKIYERMLSLPVAMRDSKVLLNLLRLHLQSDPPTAPILKIALAADSARPRVSQGELYLPSSPDPEKLELTVARLTNLVGDARVGSPELMDTHRPDEFRMRRFVAPGSALKNHSGNRRAAGAANRGKGTEERNSEPSAKPKNAFRVFRPPQPVDIDLHDGCPIRMRFRGMRGEVVAASGPWRSSGDWWREDGWHNDEWDLEIIFRSSFEPRTRLVAEGFRRKGATGSSEQQSEQRGLYRIFYDSIRQNWFVRGAYD